MLRAQSYYFRNYQVNDGVSSNTITSILQDKKGFMWFGTRNGLNRFDGHAFRIFKKDLGDSLSIGSNSILSLYEDDQEKLWVGTYKGIYLYDPVQEKFTPFKSVPSGEVRYIKGDNSGNIWIVCDFILYKYNQKTAGVSNYKLEGAETICINISEGQLWSATNSGIIKKYNAATKQFTDYNIAALHKAGPLTLIQDIYPINDTTLLVGTMNEAFLFNQKSLTIKNVFEGTPWANKIQIHKILQQNDSEYWLGTETGLFILDLKKKKSERIQKQYYNPYAITDNVIFSFCKDTEGNTWIGTFFGGINYYSREFNRFQKYFPQGNSNSLSGNLVHEICSDKSNNLWVGTEDGGLNKLNPGTGEIKQFMPGKGPGSISYQNIHGLIADENELWIGTYEHGLDVMDIRSGKVIRHYNAGNTPNSLKGNFIVTIYKTRNRDILIGTWNGMFVYNRVNDNFSPIPFFNTQIQAIHEDEKGTLWASTYGNGIYYYNPVTKDSGNFRYAADNPNTLANNYVNGLFEDSKKNYWFCTEGGLSHYETATKKFTRYNSNSLLDNQTFRVLEDNSGQLWISTSKGLVCFNTTTGSTKLYNTANGLLSDQFNYNSAFKAKDGRLYFGTVKGMISFNPETFLKNEFIPPVFITNIQVNNKAIGIHKEGSPLQQSPVYTDQITLPYDQSTLSLDVASLSYSIPEMNGYTYKMEGLDKEWTQMKNNRRIYYTKLPPGEYTFKIKGSGSGEVWNEKERTLKIKILPPIWASPWAYLLYTILGLAIAFVIFRYYHIALNEKNKRKIEIIEIEKEREIYNAKIEFFTNIAHEIRTPLTLIKLPLDKLLKSTSANSPLSESLNMMKKNTNRLIDLTDQLLDFRKAEANNISLNFIRTDITELLKELFLSFKPAAEQKQIAFRLEIPRLSLQAYVDTEAFRKILSNLFNNAIKYSENAVIVRLQPFNSDDSVFNIEIKNDGYLIPYDMKEKIFEPFYRLKETEKQAGTGIGLPLSRSLAELHKGVLDLKPPENNFNVFFLSTPIHQENEISFHEYETIETETAVAETTLQQEPADPLKLHILIVEDSREIATFLQKELTPTYTISRALNGQEALELLERENIQLIISDIMMPVMDGIELCRKIKTDLQYSHIPIILLTARNTLTSKIEGLEVGADAYIEKPFSFEHLLAQITNLLTNRNIIKEYFSRSPLTHIRGIACSKADKKFLEELNTIINDNITDLDLDVDKLSRLMNMSRTTFYRKIKALSDLTPNELINLSRLKKAAELLAEGSYKINEVANMVGYNINSNFSRDFHKQFGLTPSAYISNLQNEV